MAHIQSPDHFRNRTEIALEIVDSKKYIPTNSPDVRPIVFDEEILNATLLNINLNIKFFEKFLFGLGLSNDIGLNMTTEYQFFDFSQNDSGWISSFFSSVNLTQRSPGNSNSKDQIPIKNYRWSGGVQSVNGGFSLGYKMNQFFMSYLGFAHNQTWINTRIQQYPNSDGSDLGGIYNQYYDIYSRSVGFGLQCTYKKFYFKPQIDIIDFQTKNKNEQFILSSISFVITE